MDPKTGAIKKQKTVRFSLPDEDDPVYPYPIKIKHLCSNCEVIVKVWIEGEIVTGIKHAKPCDRCGHRSVKQSYQNLCSLCAKVTNVCSMCCGERLMTPEQCKAPINTLLSDNMKVLVGLMSTSKQRIFTKHMYKAWKQHKNPQSPLPVEEARQKLMNLIQFLVFDMW